MPFVKAAGVQVNFPFEPYPCQIDYMEKVITCYKEGQNGILESPTGTGKTLCLLCSSLAWLEDKKAQIFSHRHTQAQETGQQDLGVYKNQLAQQLDVAAGVWTGESTAPKIIYASRTHSQLSQAVQELKRTAYAHFRVSILGSREQLCIHPTVMKEDNNTTKVHLCRAKVTARDCFFYNNVENTKSHFQNKVMDIEDMVRHGEKHKCCPYYMARELKTEADIIFMPYNYLLDPKSRKAHGVELQGNIVIFDEAHNLERICEESSSFDLKSSDLASALRDIDELAQKLQNMETETQGFDMTENDGPGQDFTLEEVLRLKAQILHLEEEIDKIPLSKPEEGITKPGSFIFEILSKVNLSFDSKEMVVNLVDKMTAYLANANSSSAFSSKGAGLSKFSDVIKIVFSRQPDERSNLTFHQQAVSKHYKVHVREESKNTGYNKKKADGWGAAPTPAASKSVRVLSYWCFSPGHAMEDLKAHGVRSIILTSGTLSPMSSFKAEMGIEFRVELENPHVIEKHQVWIGVIGKGPDGVMLSSAYNNRFKDEYQASLGNAIVNFARIVPHGLLVFFPSYPVMEKCMNYWQNSNIWNRVEQYKPLFLEPRVKLEFQTAMINFYDKINDQKANGAIFAAVCRGKVSEGLDFSDNNGRAVVITGLPFPPRMDPRVMLKMEFLDDMRKKGGKGLTGQEWYRQQASRAVNQAVGRVIRHKQDYGAIILCDHRFSQPASLSQLPSWIRPHVHNYANFGLAVRDMMNFFKTAQTTLPQPQGNKAKGSARPLQCEGAYFQPTLSRHMSSKVDNIDRSSTVATHVPSLRSGYGSSGAVSLAKLKIQYDDAGPSQSTQKSLSATQHGLLSALQSRDTHTSMPGSDTQIPSYQAELTNAKEAKITQKKKIMLKKCDNNSVTKDTLQSAEQYIVEVKKTLSAESYKYFTKILCGYKKTGDYISMTASLADIFTDHPQNHHLFRKFYKFVRPHHKQQFDQTCKEIIGQGCGFKPQDAIVKKRTASNSAEGSCDKKRRLNTGEDPGQSKATKTTDKCSSVQSSTEHLDSGSHLNKTPHLPSHTSTTITTSDKSSTESLTIAAPPSIKTSNCVSDTQLLDLNTQSGVTTALGSGASSVETSTGAKLVTLKTSTVPQSREGSSSNMWAATQSLSDRGGNCDKGQTATDKENTVSREVNWDTVDWNKPKPSTTLHAEITKIDTGYTCCYCCKDATTPLKALCQHVCCLDCWKTCLGETKKCPECSQKVLRKHLTRVFFHSGPNK